MGSLDKRNEFLVEKLGDFLKEEILAASIVNSYLWKHVKVKHLTRNMRLKKGLDEKKFEEYLLDIADGQVQVN